MDKDKYTVQQKSEDTKADAALQHDLPKLSQFTDHRDAGGLGEPSMTWTGPIDDYFVEIELNSKMFLMSWSGKAHVLSECGVVLGRVEVLPFYASAEEAYACLMNKLDKQLNEMQLSHITGSFPFIEIRK